MTQSRQTKPTNKKIYALTNFEKYIDSKILERGKSYYNSDSVVEFEKLNDRDFRAVVIGTRSYSVGVELNDEQEIIRHHCTCPYNYGSYCKHEVAVLFHLRETEAYRDNFAAVGPVSRLKDRLDIMPKRDIVQLVVNQASADRSLLHDLLTDLDIPDSAYLDMDDGEDEYYW